MMGGRDIANEFQRWLQLFSLEWGYGVFKTYLIRKSDRYPHWANFQQPCSTSAKIASMDFRRPYGETPALPMESDRNNKSNRSWWSRPYYFYQSPSDRYQVERLAESVQNETLKISSWGQSFFILPRCPTITYLSLYFILPSIEYLIEMKNRPMYWFPIGWYFFSEKQI